MTLSSDSLSCSSYFNFEKRPKSVTSTSVHSQARESAYEDAYDADVPERKHPVVTPVYNGRILNIDSELVSQALCAISIKHYDGCCEQPEEACDTSDVIVYGEAYPDFSLPVFNGEEAEESLSEVSKTMSSMINLCYQTRKRAREEDGPEDEDCDKPPCMRPNINYRNSFWNLQRPEMCKLTWPHSYFGESIIINHLHKHLFNHGDICAAFHDHDSMLALLNKELDNYDALKVLHLADENGILDEIVKKKNKCLTVGPFINNFDDDWKSMKLSKEEFCITIGKPRKQSVTRIETVEDDTSEHGFMYTPAEGEYCEEYPYYEPWNEMGEDQFYYEREDVEEEDVTCDSSSTDPNVWVEPDYCAMI